MHVALLIKKIVTLLAMVDPFSMIPLFLGAVKTSTPQAQKGFARTIGLAVTLALVLSAALGRFLLGIFGISMASMKVAGGIMALMLAIAMVLGKEDVVKQAPGCTADSMSIVPLAIPLLVGPAAISYMITHSSWKDLWDMASLATCSVVVGGMTWFTFHWSLKAGQAMKASTLDVIEKVGGFILAALSVEMIGMGLKGMFPALGG